MKSYLEYFKEGNTIGELYIVTLKDVSKNNKDSIDTKTSGAFVKNGEFILADKVLEGLKFLSDELKNYVNVSNGLKKTPIKNSKNITNNSNNSASIGISLALSGYRPNPFKTNLSNYSISSSSVFLSP